MRPSLVVVEVELIATIPSAQEFLNPTAALLPSRGQKLKANVVEKAGEGFEIREWSLDEIELDGFQEVQRWRL